jgi:hypothetical protein
VDAEGDAETIYYGSEEGTEAENVNRSKSSRLYIIIDKSKVRHITFMDQPDATLYPIKEVKPDELRLDGFRWRSAERPMQVEDIFRWE